MRKNLDENIKRQLEKKMTHFIKYFPVRIRNVGEDAILNRQLMWDFKDGKGEATERVAQMTADYLKEEFGESLADIILVTIPASASQERDTLQELLQPRERADGHRQRLRPHQGGRGQTRSTRAAKEQAHQHGCGVGV